MTTKQSSITLKRKVSKRRERRRLVRLWWAVVLIWAGLVFAAESMELMPQIGEASAWNWIFLGAGMVGILGSLYRLTLSNAPSPTLWDWAWGGICLIIGLDGFVKLDLFLPLLLIFIGGIALIGGLRRRH